MSHYGEGPEWMAVRQAAARAFGTDASRIVIEIDETNTGNDGVPIVFVNYQESMKYEKATWDAVKVAVAAVLPAKFRDHKVSIV